MGVERGTTLALACSLLVCSLLGNSLLATTNELLALHNSYYGLARRGLLPVAGLPQDEQSDFFGVLLAVPE